RTMKDASLVLLSADQVSIASPYFDFLIQGMQTPS
ncbi:MAG: allophycocyanin, partial [Cyanobacteriota bacterium]|nr:allophycocyanin [Cyanobacteriota bacterium]